MPKDDEKFKKRRAKPFKRATPLTIEEVKEIFSSKLDGCITKARTRYAIIGTVAFQLAGIEGLVTHDLDVAADRSLDGFGIEPDPRAINVSWGGAGHYFVNGACIDWMVEGTPGSLPLYQAAVDGAYLHSATGLWVAPLAVAAAIKLYAGREKDILIYNELADEGSVDDKLVKELIKVYTGKTV